MRTSKSTKSTPMSEMNVSCPECGQNLVVSNTDPLELDFAADDEDDDDDDDDEDDEDDDDEDDDDEGAEDKDWEE